MVAAGFGRLLEIISGRRQHYAWVPAQVEDVAQYLQSRGIELPQGFKVLPKRWIVERTFAWLGRYRRLSKDYEYLCDTSENRLWMAMVRTMLNRVKRFIE